MKKYLISLFIIISAMFIFTQTTFAVESDYTMTGLSCKQEQSSGVYDVNVDLLITQNTEINKGTILLAFYSENNTFMDVVFYNLPATFPLEKGQSKVYSAGPISFNESVGTVKAMIWDDLSKMTPLAEAITLSPDYSKFVEVDGSLFSSIDIETNYSYGTYEDTGKAVLNIRNSTTSTSVTKYNLNNAKLYINGFEFCDVASSNATEIENMFKSSIGKVTLIRDMAQSGRIYDKILIDYYALAKVSQITSASDKITLKLGYIGYNQSTIAASQENTLTVYLSDLDEGCARLYFNNKLNNDGSALASLTTSHIVALKYNILKPLSNYGVYFNTMEILASNDTATGMYTNYDEENALYEIDGKKYEVAGYLSLTRGSYYTVALDPFGRICYAEEEVAPKNYAIVEKYNDVSVSGNSSEYDFLDVVTLEGESMRLYIDDTTTAMTTVATVIETIKGSTLSGNGIANFVGEPLANRVIEYKVKTSTGRVNDVQIAETTTFSSAKYKSSVNMLYRPLAENTTVLNASEYVYNYTNATAGDYQASSLSELSENIEYEGFLLHKNSSNQYEYVVLTVGSTKKFAIVEKYTVALESGDSSTYDYLDIVTFDGQTDRVYVDDSSTVMENTASVIASLSGGATSNGITNFTGTSPAGRVIEYVTQLGRVADISPAIVTTFTKQKYDNETNTLGQSLSDNATVLNASEYIEAGTSATIDNYIESTLSLLSEDIEYSGFLVNPYKNNKYAHVVLTAGPPKYVPVTNYAVVEKYNDVSVSGNSSEYDYLDVVTLDGQSKRLYVDNTTAAMTNTAAAIQTIYGGMPMSGIANFTGTAPDARVIEYTVRPTTGRVSNVQVVATTPFTGKKYSSSANMLYRPLADSATVLDAVEYIESGAMASSTDYKAAYLSELSENIEYSGFLVHLNSDNQYEYVVLTVGSAKKYAIVEKYTSASTSNSYSNYDYLDIVTFEGQTDRVYVDDSIDIVDVISSLSGATTSNGIINFTGTSPAGRVIEYVTHLGMATDVSPVTVTTFTNQKYDSSSNTLGQALSDIATVLNASEYIQAGTSATTDDYIESMLSELSEDIEYSGFLVCPDKNNKYAHVVLTVGPPKYVPVTNYAIVEKYNDVSTSGNGSEYDFIDVMTLDGQPKRLYIDNTSAAMTNTAAAIQTIYGGMPMSGIANFTGASPASRVIEYTIRSTTGRVSNVQVVATTIFSGARYNSSTNQLYKPLADNAIVLDASKYVENGYSAAAKDYKASSLSALSESVNYEGFLIHQNNLAEYEYLVLTYTGPKYNASSNFAVAAVDASSYSMSIIDDEEVYTLRVMKDGSSKAEVIYISPTVIVSCYNGSSYVTYPYSYNVITKGSAFFYTVNDYGFVDRIDVVLKGQSTFDAYRDTALATLVQTPDTATPNIIDASDWYVTPDDSGLSAVNQLVQLYIAPVVDATDKYVAFSAMAEDAYGRYVDTNILYYYAIAENTNIYYYDMSDSAPTNYTAFSNGVFSGIDLRDTTSDGKAYVEDVYYDYTYPTNFDEAIQVAFVMVVDGVITNALIIGQ